MGRFLFIIGIFFLLLVPPLGLAEDKEEEVTPSPVVEGPAPVPEIEKKAPIVPAQVPPSVEEKGVRAITLEELSGIISASRKKVIIINFWSPYCEECQKLLPSLTGLYSKYGFQGLEVIGISLGGDSEKVWMTIKKMRINYPAFMGDADVFHAYDVHTLPAILFIGKDGKVEEKEEGHTFTEKKLEQEILRLLEGHPKSKRWWKFLSR